LLLVCSFGRRLTVADGLNGYSRGRKLALNPFDEVVPLRDDRRCLVKAFLCVLALLLVGGLGELVSSTFASRDSVKSPGLCLYLVSDGLPDVCMV
jgi:hypothetical protein